MSDYPDWHDSIVIAGSDGSNVIPVLLDSSGTIIAVMKGEYLGTLKTIALDANGIMKANLSVQDLEQMTVRERMGTPLRIKFANNVVASSANTLCSLTDKQGYLHSAHVRSKNTASVVDDLIQLYIDSNIWGSMYFTDYEERDVVPFGVDPVVFSVYNIADDIYSMFFRGSVSFEDGFELKYTENSGNTPYVTAWVLYSYLV